MHDGVSLLSGCMLEGQVRSVFFERASGGDVAVIACQRPRHTQSGILVAPWNSHAYLPTSARLDNGYGRATRGRPHDDCLAEVPPASSTRARAAGGHGMEASERSERCTINPNRISKKKYCRSLTQEPCSANELAEAALVEDSRILSRCQSGLDNCYVIVYSV